MTRTRNTETIRQKFRPAVALAFALAAATTITASGGHSSCNCNPAMGDAQLVEWDLPQDVVMDTSSGAITVDVHASHHGKLWFVSRVGMVKLYQFNPGNPAPKKTATWQSWELNPLSFQTGGLFRIKVHKNDREVFVRTDTSLQSINTGQCTKDLMLFEECERITWSDRANDQVPDITPHVSDLSSDDCNVYTTTGFTDPSAAPLPALSYLQQLNKCRFDSQNGDTGTTIVKRWNIGGGAGFCETALDSSPCISGVSVDPHREYLVYFSQPASNEIGELDVRNNNVRRWNLSKLGADVFEPRQLDVDWDGTVWAVTGSGHLVRLDPKRNRMSRHFMPSGVSADPFGVAPDHGAIGYTNSASTENKVAMLFPKGNTIYVAPSIVCIQPQPVSVPFTIETAAVEKGTSNPVVKTVHADITDKEDGKFIEARINQADGDLSPSFVPLGITADLSHKVGTYFYAVGRASSGLNRVGQIVLPTKHQKHGHARDDDDHDRDGKRDDEDDDDDDDGKKDHDDDDDDNDCVKDNDDDDDDNDGIKDGDDHKGKKERRDTRSDEMASGQATDYDMTMDSTNLILAATVTSLDPTTLIKVEVYNAAGTLVASPPATPGVALVTVPTLTAGTYKVRVKNLGFSTAQLVTETLTRSEWPIVLPTLQ